MTVRPTIEELEARVREALEGVGLAKYDRGITALTDLTARAREAEEIVQALPLAEHPVTPTPDREEALRLARELIDNPRNEPGYHHLDVQKVARGLLTLAADLEVAERDLATAREALEEILQLREVGWYAHPSNFDKRVRRIARAALRSLDGGVLT